MSKSVYSVVLSDEVVAAIDRLAAGEGISRSRMIDRILARHAGCETAAGRASDILGCVERMAANAAGFRLLAGASGELLQLRSAVRYRYNPTVRYTVELYRHPTDALGELRVTLRSQSRGLLEEMDRFFRLWTRLEERSFADGSFLSYDLAEGRFSRRLRCAGCTSGEEAGSAIAGYIRLMDAVMQAYFVTLPSGQRAAATAAAERFAGALTDEVAGV